MSINNKIVDEIVKILKHVLNGEKAPLHEPSFIGNEWDYVKQTIDSTFVSSVGNFVNKFEEDLTKITGSKYAIATINGTSALHIALKLAGVEEGDEVLIPSLSFVATANAVVYCNASPHFIDNSKQTLGIDTDKLAEYLTLKTEMKHNKCINKETGKIIRAIVPMHTFGHPVDMTSLIEKCNSFNIKIVEDAAESLGSFYKDKHTGTFGLLSALSFNGNKIVTTGGGGAILTNNKTLAEKAKHITTTAKVSHEWNFYHDQVGYNYRMPNLNAALGCAQLENLPLFIKKKRNLYNLYYDYFKSIPDIEVIAEPKDCKSNYWLQTIRLSGENKILKDEIIEATNKVGISTRPTWTLLHKMNPFKKYPKMDLTNALIHEQTLINIPSSAQIMDKFNVKK